MTGLEVRAAAPDEVERWDEIVSAFPGARVTHSKAWLRSLQAAGHGDPRYLVVTRHGRIVGCAPGLLTTVGPLRLFGSPLPGWQTQSMGPVFDPAVAATGDVVGALVPFLEARHGVHHIEIASRSLDGPAMEALGFRGAAVPTFRGPLFPGDEERTFRTLKDSARRNIRRAAKLGLVVTFEDDEAAFVDEHYDQMKEVFVRGGHTIPFSRRRVHECFRHLKAAGNLVAVSVSLPSEPVRIATGMFTISRPELLLWSWAHRAQYRWYRATEVMTWTVMRRAMQGGCDVFDLMGEGDFKAKFGAVLDEGNRRWVRSRYSWLGRLRDWANTGYRWQQAVRGRLARLAVAAEPAQGPSVPSTEGDV